MTDTTNPGDVYVVGQRRAGPSAIFPSSPTRQQLKERDTEPGGGGGARHPCTNPAGKRDWNADAAAAEALKRMIALAIAKDGYLGHREWGAVLFQNANGTIGIGPITYGPPFTEPDPANGRAYVALDYTGIPDQRIIGSIHTHNPGSYIPSGNQLGGGDWSHFDNMITRVRSALGNENAVRIYIAAQDLAGAGQQPSHRIHVYDNRNRQAAISGVEGPEVNSEARPCPN